MKRLGILISDGAVRALIVRRGRVIWHADSAIGQSERTSVALERVMSRLPRSRFGRMSVRVAFGLAHSDEKCIEGLPPTRQPKLLNRLVKENADAFFLRRGARTFVSDLQLRSDGSAWASAFDAALLDEVFSVLRERRLVAGVMSFAAAIANAVPPGTWCVRDENLELHLTTIEGAVIQPGRRRATAAAASVIPSATGLDAIGADGPQFLAALGAAIAPARAAIAWRPPPDPSRARLRHVAQVVAASLLLLASATAALLARGVHADRVASAATKELARFQASDDAAARVDAELRRTTAELDRVGQFESVRGRVTLLLGAMSEALPDSTALVSLRVDSLEANIVALTPHAASVLPALLDVSDVVSPRIVGSVTREVQGATRVERASIRFRRNRVSLSPVQRDAR